MPTFFPEGKTININGEVELLAFQCQDTVVQLAAIAPGAIFPLHQHTESQIGMIFNGNLEMNLNGNKTIIQPLDHLYVAGANVLHGSANLLPETILGFDVKRIINPPRQGEDKPTILRVTPTENHATGLPCQSVTGSWFEIMITQIPPGKTIPKHQSSCQKMGIILNGKLDVYVGGEEQQLAYGNIYYAPPEIPHEISNFTDETVSLLDILITQ
jgi:bacilysin biosynthesis protein BacB